MSFFEVSILILVILIFLLIFTILILNFYVYFGFRKEENIIRSGPSLGSEIALTFDDGPDPRYTPEILDILKKYKIKATFFVLGRNVKKYPALAKRVVEEDHLIGNHSYNHANLLLYKTKTVIRQLQKTNEIILRVTGQYPLFFRPPRGLYNQKIKRGIRKMGQKIVLWNISSQDWRGLKGESMAKKILKKIKGGSIILFHDSGNLVYNKEGNHENTVEALPYVITTLKDQGYKLVRLDEFIL